MRLPLFFVYVLYANEWKNFKIFLPSSDSSVILALPRKMRKNRKKRKGNKKTEQSSKQITKWKWYNLILLLFYSRIPSFCVHVYQLFKWTKIIKENSLYLPNETPIFIYCMAVFALDFTIRFVLLTFFVHYVIQTVVVIKFYENSYRHRHILLLEHRHFLLMFFYSATVIQFVKYKKKYS